MTEGGSGLFASAPEAVFYLVQDRETAEELKTEKVEFLDEQPGVQASLDLEELADSDLFDQLLHRAKLGSRWGKDLSKVYYDYLQSRIEQIDNSALIDEFESQFGRYDADPYESAVLGNAMSIGIDLTEQIQKELDKWEQQQFTRDDFAAAVGISARSEGIGERNNSGGIVFRSEEPLSEIKQHQEFIRASQNLQHLILMGLDVALIAPVGGADEEEIIETTFRGVGSFSVETVAGAQFEISDEITDAVDEWYDRLLYDVSDNRVVENVVRPASVTAYDLPEDPWTHHFRNAIMIGLQGAYSDKSFNEDDFNELWDERISSHPNYDQYRSRRNTFPDVKVTRKNDEVSHQFVLHHEGPSAKAHVCGLPARSVKPEKELIDVIERFLDAERVSEQRWQELVSAFENIGESLSTCPEVLAENAILYRQRRRQSLSPLIPPTDKTEGDLRGESEYASYDNEWYDRHWSTILSDFAITKQGGVGAIERKQDLLHSLDPELEADEALYYKLEQDISNAWEYYLDSIVEELKQSLTADQNLSIERSKTSSGREIEVTIVPKKGQKQTVTIDILLPYSDVYVSETRVPTATVTNTVSEVIDALGTVIQTRDHDFSRETSADLLYHITKVYLDVAEFQQGDLVYFDDLIEFCLSLPYLQNKFETPEQDVEANIRNHLGSDQYMTRLRELGVSFHRKGSDQHGSVKVQGDQYIAMELQDPLE